MKVAEEISVLKHLVRATCQSADQCATASRACLHDARAPALDQLCEDRRRLAADLVRCLLLRGVPEPDVRMALTSGPHVTLTGIGLGALWIDVEIAEKKLHETLRQVLANTVLSEPVRELLSLHFLRFKLHHDQLGDLIEQAPSAVWGERALEPQLA